MQKSVFGWLCITWLTLSYFLMYKRLHTQLQNRKNAKNKTNKEIIDFISLWKRGCNRRGTGANGGEEEITRSKKFSYFFFFLAQELNLIGVCVKADRQVYVLN